LNDPAGPADPAAPSREPPGNFSRAALLFDLLVGVVQRYGYLYLRSAGATEPLLSLKTAAALPPNKGLAAEPRFVAAIKHIGAGDAVFYSRPAEGGEPQQKGRLSGEVGSFAFAVSDKPQLLELRFFAQLRNLSGEQLVAAFKPPKPPPVEREGTDAMVDGLAAKLPAGAASYLRISASPQWRGFERRQPSSMAFASIGSSISSVIP